MATSGSLVGWYARTEAAALRDLMALLGPLPEEWISSLGVYIPSQQGPTF